MTGNPRLLRIDPAFETYQIERVRDVRARRDGAAAAAALEALEQAAREPDQNLMPLLLEAAHAEVTEGEMVQTLQKVFGTYSESPEF